jgi:DNA-binding transcriptional LysR family regulator
MDRLSQLRCFVRSAELGSFSRAAQEAGVKPSSVSRAITELETHLRAALFNRSTRRLHLTEVGNAFLLRARRILDDLDDAYSDTAALNTRPAGLLRLNVPGSFGRLHVVPFLPIFAEKYPDIKLDVTFTDEIVDIIQTGTDLAIRTGALPDSRLIARKLATHKRVLCASPGFVAAHGPIASPAELTRCPAILFSLQPNDRWILLDRDNRREDIVCTGWYRANDSEALLAATQSGFGIGLLPTWLIGDALRAGRLVRLLPEYEAMFALGERFVWAVYPPKKVVAPKVRVFIDGFSEHIGVPPYWDRVGGEASKQASASFFEKKEAKKLY